MLQRFTLASSLLKWLLGLYTSGIVLWLLVWRLLGDANGWIALANAWSFWWLLSGLPLGAVALGRHSGLLAGGWLAVLSTLFWRHYRRHLTKREGAPVFATSRSAGTTTDSVSHLVILSANLRNRPRDLCSAVQSLCTQNADLLLLQEAIADHVEQLEPALAADYPYRCWVPYCTTNMGLGVASRIPFAVTGFWQDLGLEPYALRLTLGLLDGPLDVYCVHFIAPSHQFRRWGPTRLLHARERQIQTVLAAVDGRSYPAVVAGDWNSTEGADTYRWVTAQLVDGWLEGGSGPGWTWPRMLDKLGNRLSQPLLRLDYLFHTGSTRNRRIVVTAMRRVMIKIGSDHCPIVADLTIRPEA